MAFLASVHLKTLRKLKSHLMHSWIHYKIFFADVVLNYFSTALGPALTDAAALGWSNFMDLMIEVVKETVERNYEQMKNAALYKLYY